LNRRLLQDIDKCENNRALKEDAMGEIRDRLTADLKIRGYSEGTCEVYLRYVIQFVRHYHRSPDEMGADEIRAFLLHMVTERHLSRETMRIARAAIKFLYAVTLRRPIEVDWIPVPRREKRLPDVLSGSEVLALLGAVRSPRYRAVLETMYAGGLRIAEACALRVKDVDSKRGVLRVRGKGNRERVTLLSSRLLEHLREYWREARPGRGEDWLFPGRERQHFLSPGSVRTVFHKAASEAGLRRKVTPHVLRHCFATHLIELGVDVTVVQALLGHASLSTTEKYVHVSTEQILRTRSPFDLLGTDEARILG
jgi:integrase/recombinase XerD